MSHDDRGLHPRDTGFVYAVRRPHGSSRHRKFFKSRSDAMARARYWIEQGERVEVLRYVIRDERQIWP